MPEDNPWRWQKERNPYLHNVFSFLQLADPDVPDAVFDYFVQTLERRFKGHRVSAVFGYQPTEVDLQAVNAAQINPNRLTVEKLLVHRFHVLDPAQFEQLAGRLSEMDPGAPAAMLPLPVINLAPITRRLPEPRAVRSTAVAPPNPKALLPLLAPRPEDERPLPL